MLPWAAHILRTKVGAGLILGEAIIIVAYVAGLSYAAFYKSNPFTNPIRTGFLAVSQLPIVLALAAKNNIPGMLLGISYEHVRLDPDDGQSVRKGLVTSYRETLKTFGNLYSH